MDKDYSLDELKALNITKLKKIAKESGVKGYSSFKSGDEKKLAQKIFDHLSSAKRVVQQVERKVQKPVQKYDEKGLKKLKVPELKELASSLGLRPSKRRKASLIKIILEQAGLPPPSPKRKRKVSRRVSKPTRAKVAKRARKAKEIVEKKVSRKPAKRRRKIVDDDLLKKKVTELKALLKEKGIEIGLSGKNKETLIKYLNSPRCDPENQEFCPDDMICDVRNKLCIDKEDLPKNLASFNYMGREIVGSKKAIDALTKKLQAVSPCDPENNQFCSDDMVCDLQKKICISPNNVPANFISYKYKGKEIVGSSDAIEKLKQKLEPELKEAEEIVEVPAIDEEELEREVELALQPKPSLAEGIEIKEIEEKPVAGDELAALLGEEILERKVPERKVSKEKIPKPEVIEEEVVEIPQLPPIEPEPAEEIRELSEVQQYVVSQCLGLQM